MVAEDGRPLDRELILRRQGVGKQVIDDRRFETVWSIRGPSRSRPLEAKPSLGSSIDEPGLSRPSPRLRLDRPPLARVFKTSLL